MLKYLKWLDDNIISLLAGFLLVFIPLYPKLPLFDLLPGYIVRARMEDLMVGGVILIWLIWLIRGKTRLGETLLTKSIGAYLLAGLLSIISAILIINTVPLQAIHLEKIFLHYIRRIEYFSLFFIFYSAVKNLKTLKIFLILLLVTALSVSLYGFGQKYFYWPAFSTMNREFAKGWMLYLTKYARVISTFAGHYDLAAFIMMVLVMFWSIFFGVKKIFYKILVFGIIAAAFWTLILTASRTSFIAYLGGLTLMFFFWAFKRGIAWSISRWLMVVFLSIVIMLSFGDLSERFTKLLRIDERLGGLKSLLLSPIGVVPQDKAYFLENNPQAALSQITSKSDQPPTPLRPNDVYQDIPLMIPDEKGSTVTAVARTYSKTAFMYDLSTAIRFDALWPQAVKGFKRNPLLGSGYSTLNKQQPTDFTEAESTDNDYLRSLGETGILGFVTFFGTLILLIYLIFRYLTIIEDPILFSAAVGFCGLLFGLLINALYIDVFESSKVAFSFWALAGTILAGIDNVRRKAGGKVPLPRIPDWQKYKSQLVKKTVNFFKGDSFLIIILLVIGFYVRTYRIQTPLADWHSWRQADTSSVTRNYVKNGINILYPTYDDLSNVASGHDNPKGYRFVEFPLYNIASVVTDKIFVGYNIEFSGRLTSIFASLGTLFFLFLIVRKYLGRKTAFLASLFFAILPYNIFYSRVILPEPMLVFTTTAMIYFFDQFADKLIKLVKDTDALRKFKIVILLIISLLFSAASLLVKPFAIFLFLPLFYIWFSKKGFKASSIIFFLVFLFLTGLPLILWRMWISRFPEGIPAYTWLLNGDGIRFKGAFFYWIFADRIGRLILGYWGIALLVAGLTKRFKDESWLFFIWGIAIILYFFTIATGNVRHDYYQIVSIPIIAIFLAKGVMYILSKAENFRMGITSLLIVAVCITFMEMFAWYHIRDYYNINHPEIVEAGQAVEKLTPSASLVIAPYNGDTAFLYQTHRAGWPIMEGSVDEMIKRGAHYYVSVNYDDLTKKLIANANNPDISLREYKMVEMTSKFAIIQLVPDKELPK